MQQVRVGGSMSHIICISIKRINLSAFHLDYKWKKKHKTVYSETNKKIKMNMTQGLRMRLYFSVAYLTTFATTQKM
jgi:hypothetical protein